MSKDALWLLATVLLCVVIGVGVAYYFLVYKKPVASIAVVTVSPRVVAYGSAVSTPSFNKRERDLRGGIFRLKMSIGVRKEALRVRKEALRTSPSDKVAALKKLIDEDEASLKEVEKELEEYLKANPKRAQRLP